MDIKDFIGQEIETLRKEQCMLCIEDSDDEESAVVEYVPDSQDYVSDSEDSSVVEMKEEDDDELILVTGESKEIYKTRDLKSASAWTEKGVHSKSKSRDLASGSCYNDILFVLSDDERSPAAIDVKDKGSL